MSGKNQAQLRFERHVQDNLLKDFRELISDEESTSGPGAEDSLDADVLLRDAVQARATDLHLDPFPDHYRARLRIDGIIVDAMELSPELGRRLSHQFKALANLDPVPSVRCSEGGLSYALDEKDLDLRVTAVPCVSGDKLAIRMLSPAEGVQEIRELGIPGHGVEWIGRWMDATGGMFLVAGPTGSGKTTTLYALLHELKLSDSHVITLEDPVEYEVPGINQIQVNPVHDLTFATGTPAMLRLDPDYVLIGEIRDEASAHAAISVATSGRALMGTLHSRDAVGTITALRNLGLDDYEIASNLGLVAAQRLVRKLCPECRAKRPPDEVEKRWLQDCGREIPETTWAARGCSSCDHLGFRGRTGIFEVWQPGEEDYAMILRHENEHALRHALITRGEPLMLDDGIAKVEEGITTLRELLRTGTLLPDYQSV